MTSENAPIPTAQMISDGWRQCARGQHTTQFCGQLEEAAWRTTVKAEHAVCAWVPASERMPAPNESQSGYFWCWGQSTAHQNYWQFLGTNRGNCLEPGFATLMILPHPATSRIGNLRTRRIHPPTK